jgi:hypothetical protein
MDFFQSRKLPNRCYLAPISPRSIALVKRLAGSKGLKLIPANKVLLKVAFLYIDGLLSVAQTVNRCYLTFFQRSNVQLLVKRLAGSPKLKLIPTLR